MCTTAQARRRGEERPKRAISGYLHGCQSGLIAIGQSHPHQLVLAKVMQLTNYTYIVIALICVTHFPAASASMYCVTRVFYHHGAEQPECPARGGRMHCIKQMTSRQSALPTPVDPTQDLGEQRRASGRRGVRDTQTQGKGRGQVDNARLQLIPRRPESPRNRGRRQLGCILARRSTPSLDRKVRIERHIAVP